MSSDRLLSALLRALQIYSDQQDIPRLLGTAVSLLTSLNNPRNVTLLTSQLLVAPALWSNPDGLRTSLSFMGVFHSSALRFLERERALNERGRNVPVVPNIESHLSLTEWTHAVIKGADEQSSASRHLLVLGGMLVGFGNQDDEILSRHFGETLRSALVKAANLALQESQHADDLSHCEIALVLNHSFTYLSDIERSKIEYDRLMPILMTSMLHSVNGLRSGYFIGAADPDVRQVSSQQFNWSKTSGSYQQVNTILTSPLISNLGPLSRLISHTLEHVQDSWLVLSAVEDLADFSRRLLMQWRQNKLSEIDASEEVEYLLDEARQITVPTLWKLLRSTLFAVVIVFRSAVGRLMGDGVLATNDNAPHMAQETLHAFRSLSFIHSRLGSTAFSQYTFTYLAALDVLASYPLDAEDFLKSTAPSELGSIPDHPLERCLDLFFLNTAEQLSFGLTPSISEQLVIAAAMPYLTSGGNPKLLPIFEAAHSNMLAVFSTPQNVDITTKHLPFYVDALFQVFPHNLSPRQFRFAFKNLIRLTSPPSRIAASQPMLAATLLEIVHDRVRSAPTSALPLPTTQGSIASPLAEAEEPIMPKFSEQAVLISTIVDSLPSLSHSLLEEWLPLTAALINCIPDLSMRDHCKRHFWDTLVGGEMDPERSQICVDWWTSRGGRETLLYGDEILGENEEDKYKMSGALEVEKPVLAKL
ncbi:hypothetical protein AAFC00_007170 [Neodothiora populina]|uniref:Peroxisomal membrane protein Pex17 n=1 Tax=Neodothiora populina TaxID=2781224 RepID=A0ABR3PHE6_9PEZI